MPGPASSFWLDLAGSGDQVTGHYDTGGTPGQEPPRRQRRQAAVAPSKSEGTEPGSGQLELCPPGYPDNAPLGGA